MKNKEELSKLNLEWYAMVIDFNSKKEKYINVLSIRELQPLEIARRIKTKVDYMKIKNYDDLKHYVDMELKSMYWSRCEYEMMCCDFPYNKNKLNLRKIDVYDQLKPNIDRIVEYIIKEMKIKFKE